MPQRIGGVDYGCRHCLGPAIELCSCPCHEPRTDGWEGRAPCEKRKPTLADKVNQALDKKDGER